MIDLHTHPVMIRELHERNPDLTAAVRNVFGLLFPPQPLELFYRELDAAEIERAVLLPLDCTTAHGCTIVSNDEVAELVSASERFVGFCSVDPRRPGAPKELERGVGELALAGLKLDPALQRFDPASRRFAFPLYERCLAYEVPVMVHCGLSLAPRGAARFARPLSLEPVLEEFPDLTLVIPHLAWPFVEEALVLAVKHPRVYLDTSVLYGGAPKDALAHVLLGRIGRHVVESALASKLVFGSNYPRVDIRRSVRAVQALALSESVRRSILGGAAERLLGKQRSPARPGKGAKQ